MQLHVAPSSMTQEFFGLSNCRFGRCNRGARFLQCVHASEWLAYVIDGGGRNGDTGDMEPPRGLHKRRVTRTIGYQSRADVVRGGVNGSCRRRRLVKTFSGSSILDALLLAQDKPFSSVGPVNEYGRAIVEFPCGVLQPTYGPTHYDALRTSCEPADSNWRRNPCLPDIKRPCLLHSDMARRNFLMRLGDCFHTRREAVWSFMKARYAPAYCCSGAHLALNKARNGLWAGEGEA